MQEAVENYPITEIELCSLAKNIVSFKLLLKRKILVLEFIIQP